MEVGGWVQDSGPGLTRKKIYILQVLFLNTGLPNCMFERTVFYLY